MARIAIALLAVSLGLAACGQNNSEKSKPSAGAAAQPADQVVIKGFAYKPPDVSVKAGTKLTFVNQDSAKHTATDSTTKAFDTGTLGKGQSKAVTIKKPGTYAYVCSFHAFMKGKVTVK